MATINLGAIKFNWKGAYNNSTAYVVDDVVSSGGSSYICILASQGNAVSNGTYWSLMAQAGTNGTNGTDLSTTLTTQGDIVYRDGSGLQRLAAGTSGQVLQTGGSGANPSWTNLSSDYVKLASGTIGNVASISIDGYYTSDYDVYKVFLFDVRNDTANRQLYWRFNSGGSALTASNYRFVAKGNFTQSNQSANDTQTQAWGADKGYTAWDLSTGADRGSPLEMTIFNPLGTTNEKFWQIAYTIDVQDANYITSMTGGGYYNDGGASAHSGVTFFPQSNNFNTGGKWKLYGIKA